MARFRFRCSNVVFALTMWVTIVLPTTLNAQFLKPGETAPAPEFRDVTQWINTEPLSMAQLRGKVVIVHFWTNGCSNCINNYKHYKSWQKRYAGKDVVIVGIHTPETASEREVARIKDQATKHGLLFPIAVDNNASNWNAWNNRFWPAVYVVDRRGQVRYGWEGELNYQGAAGEVTIRNLVDSLLKESP